MRRALWATLGILALLGVGSWLAGERTEVVVLRTFDAAGAVYETRLWAVDQGGAVWVRVANPGRAWYQRLRANPRVELIRERRKRAMLAAPDESPEARRAVDAAFSAKYGLVDAWYGLLLRRDPVPIRLTPVDS